VKNLISKACQAFDNGVMEVVSTVVRVYNWTTGDTKAGLANKMLMVAPILESAGIYSLSPAISAIIIPSNLLLSHVVQKANTEQEEKEANAFNSNSLNLSVELRKKELREYTAPRGLVYSGTFGGVTHLLEFEPMVYGVSAGFAVRAFSDYVMCVDHLPPRKNCLSRGLDRLGEIVAQYKPEPIPVPQLAQQRSLF